MLAVQRRRPKAWILAGGIGLLSLGSERADAGTREATLEVSAQVAAPCVVRVNAQLSFSEYDVSSAAPRDAASGLTIACATRARVLVSIDQGTYPLSGSSDAIPLRRMVGPDGHTLSYYLYTDAARSIPWGNTQATSVLLPQVAASGGSVPEGNLTVFGRVPAGQRVTSGAYRDYVLATIRY